MSARRTVDNIALTDDTSQRTGVMWSRSAGLLSQTGSADSELKCKVSEDVSDDFRRLARSMGMTVSEFLRIMVVTRLYGVDGVADMTRRQLAAVSGELPGPEKAPT
jgi:hypothetical protein